MQFVDGLGVQAPEAPVYMPSAAPIVGGGLQVHPCPCESGSARTNISLLAEDPDGDALTITIATLPVHGSLTALDGTALSSGAVISEDEVRFPR